MLSLCPRPYRQTQKDLWDKRGGRGGCVLPLQSPTPLPSCQVWQTALRLATSPRWRGKGECSSDSGGLGWEGTVRASEGDAQGPGLIITWRSFTKVCQVQRFSTGSLRHLRDRESPPREEAGARCLRWMRPAVLTAIAPRLLEQWVSRESEGAPPTVCTSASVEGPVFSWLGLGSPVTWSGPAVQPAWGVPLGDCVADLSLL